MGKKEWEKPEFKVISKEELKAKQKDFCTASVLKFLRENDELVDEYLTDVRDIGKVPNYSDFLRRHMGTTAEKVNLASIYVRRSSATKYLVERFYTLFPEEVRD